MNENQAATEGNEGDRRCRAKAKRDTSANVRFFQALFGPSLRANARMPLEAHRECGRLLRQVARATEGRTGANEPVKFVLNTLDSWAMLENDRDEFDMETLGSLYCPGPRLEPEGQVGLPEQIKRLERARHLLVTYYPGGLALQGLLREIDLAIASIVVWHGKRRGKVYRDPAEWREIRLRQWQR